MLSNENCAKIDGCMTGGHGAETIKSNKQELTGDKLRLWWVTFTNAQYFWSKQDDSVKNKISEELLKQITDTLVYKRPEYIQLLDKTLGCFQHQGIRLTSTMDEELEYRFILNNFKDLIYKIKHQDYDINSWLRDFLSWKEEYLLDPLKDISFFNSEIQEQIQRDLKDDAIEGISDAKADLKSLNNLYNFIFDSRDKNEQMLSETDEDELDILGESKTPDILTKTETMIKRISSILMKIINLHSGDREITIDDINQKIYDIPRSTVYLDDIPDLDSQKILEFVVETNDNLQKLYQEGSSISLNNKKYEIVSSKIINDIRYKPTGYADISFMVELDTIDANQEETSFKLEIQAHTRKAIEVKKIEDEIYAQRKDVRNSLSGLVNFKDFERIIISQSQNIVLGFIDRIGLKKNFEESGLTFDEFVKSKDYRNLYLDCLLINFTTLIEYFEQTLAVKIQNQVIFRLFQDMIPLSFQMRRFVAEANDLYSEVGLFKSSKEAQDLYSKLIDLGLENINADITDIDLKSSVSVEGDLLYFGEGAERILIGSIANWSKLLRCDYEKVPARIQLLLAPNWHTNKFGDIEKIPEPNTRFIVHSQGKIALVYNETFGEWELSGADDTALVDEKGNYQDSLIDKKLQLELGRNIEKQVLIGTSLSAGKIVLDKKLKNVSILMIETTRNTETIDASQENQTNQEVIWIDPIELLIWKYWLNKPLCTRPARYEIPLAPYATFTDEILSQLEYSPNKKFTPEIIDSIGKIVFERKGIVTPDYVRLEILQKYSNIIL